MRQVDSMYEQIVFGEATITFPLLASFSYYKKWLDRKDWRLNGLLGDASIV